VKLKEVLKADRSPALPDRFPSWSRLMRGLNLSGLRLEESTNLWWDRLDSICILNIDGRYPVLQIPAGYQKARRETTYSLAPDFVEFLRETPKQQRTGPVFLPLGKTRAVRSSNYIVRTISEAGAAAKIVVSRDGDSVTYATAQNLRRSFGDRWALTVMPVVLKELMRPRTLDTTMKYYVGYSAEQTADIVWQASVPDAGGNKIGNHRERRKSSKP